MHVSFLRWLRARFSKPASKSAASRLREAGRHRDFDSVKSYYHAVRKPEDVDGRTWDDLDLDGVFHSMDRTSSLVGRQTLYKQLHRYEHETELAERTRQQTALRQEPAYTSSLQASLHRLDTEDTTYLAPLLLNPFPARPSWSWVIYLCATLPVLFLLGGLFFPKLLFVAFGFVVVNAFIYLTYGQRIALYFAGFSQIDQMLSVAERLGKMPDPYSLPQLRFLRSGMDRLARLRRRLGVLIINRETLGEIGQAVFAYLNLAFLLDVISFFRATTALQGEQMFLVSVFDSIGSLDAACSTASWIGGLSLVCVPRFVDGLKFEVSDLCHPLILSPVGNSINLQNRSALVTGPNMAGKTSFIKAVGVNVILAQTLHIALAREAYFPRSAVRSAIRREDNVSKGESYFYAEIQQILEFIHSSPTRPCVFLIDEIFRGTNTVERIASSAAVLRHLSKSHVVFVTTHDVELQRLLDGQFEMFHFCDHIVEGRYDFDYKLRPGPARSRNAIRLLALSKYPKEIVDEATAIADSLG